jgi:hypothetical protein
MNRLRERRGTSPRPTIAVLVAFAMLAACGRSVPSELRVEGPRGFVRCLALEPPAPRQWTAGGLSLAIEGRVLTIGGVTAPLYFAAFAGPSPASLGTGQPLATVRPDSARFAFVLGGLGDDAAAATRTARALAATGVVTLFVAGGRDEPEVVAAALAALDDAQRDRVLDVTALERIVIGRAEFVPVGGAPGGRYARSSAACGHDAADLDARAAALGGASDSVRRILLSWAAASPVRGIEGAEAGDAELARFATRIGAEDALAAWPHEQVGHALPGAARRWVVPAVGVLAALGPEGGRTQPGTALFGLGPSGLSFSRDAAGAR